MKKLMLLAVVVLAALVAAPHQSQASFGVCDPTRSNLCVGLVDSWDFTEITNASACFGSFANTLLLKNDLGGMTIGGNKVGSGGSACLGNASQADSLMIPRAGGFSGGNWTWAAWVYSAPTSTAREATLFTNHDGGATDGFGVRFLYVSGAWYLNAFAWEAETNTSYMKQFSSSTSTSSWHLVVVTMSPYGDYGKSQACLSIDGSAFECGAMGYMLKGNVRDLHFGASGTYATGYNPVCFDGMAIWSRTFDATDVANLHNSGTGRAFPYY
jgi:hypothetical protein